MRASDRIDLATGLPLQGPPNDGFDPEHPFGVAPKSGNDRWPYWLFGCRTSLIIATVATVVSTIIGVTLGLLAGFAGRRLDRVIQFITDIFLTLPFLLGRAGRRADPIRTVR